nr:MULTISPECIES: glycosyltransferase family 2 protein [Moraxella]
MNTELISVVIPVYNTENYLRRCLESVINQTYKNLQIIIVDDGSNDDTKYICQEFAKLDNRIELIQKDNEGVSIARNLGIEMAKGEWIYFLDSDDYLEKEAFEQLLVFAMEHNPDIIQFGVRDVNDTGHIRTRVPQKFAVYNNNIDFIRNNNLTPLSLWVHLYKLDFINQHHLRFNENMAYAEDLLFTHLAIFEAHTIMQIDKIFYNYYLSHNSATRKAVKITVLYDHLKFLDEISQSIFKLNANKQLKNYFFQLSKYLFILPNLLEKKSMSKHADVVQDKYRHMYLNNPDLFRHPMFKIAYLNFTTISKLYSVRLYINTLIKN